MLVFSQLIMLLERGWISTKPDLSSPVYLYVKVKLSELQVIFSSVNFKVFTKLSYILSSKLYQEVWCKYIGTHWTKIQKVFTHGLRFFK